MHIRQPKMGAANVANVTGAVVCALGDTIRSATTEEERDETSSAALVHLAKYPGETVEALRGPLDLSHSGCVRLVDRMAAAGYVERRVGSEDGRAVAIHLTRRGRDVARRVLEARAHTLDAALTALTSAERETFGRLVGKLLEHHVGSGARALRVCRLCDYVACTTCPVARAVGPAP
jgi:DNA-binding MarR family transcriptional regulator